MKDAGNMQTTLSAPLSSSLVMLGIYSKTQLWGDKFNPSGKLKFMICFHWLDDVVLVLPVNPLFPLWGAPAGNHGSSVNHHGLDISCDEYNYHDSLWWRNWPYSSLLFFTDSRSLYIYKRFRLNDSIRLCWGSWFNSPRKTYGDCTFYHNTMQTLYSP